MSHTNRMRTEAALTSRRRILSRLGHSKGPKTPRFSPAPCSWSHVPNTDLVLPPDKNHFSNMFCFRSRQWHSARTSARTMCPTGSPTRVLGEVPEVPAREKRQTESATREVFFLCR